jgi:hypothetical protein
MYLLLWSGLPEETAYGLHGVVVRICPAWVVERCVDIYGGLGSLDYSIQVDIERRRSRQYHSVEAGK